MSLHTHPFTLGVEEEYQVIDPSTYELSPAADIVLTEAKSKLGTAVQYEMLLSQIEIATPVCHTLQEVYTELARLRSGVIDAADHTGRLIGAAGLHPFSHWRDQQVTPKARYRELIDTYQQSIREQVIFGCHVHVGVPDRDVAALVLNHARIWLAPLIALTANSPFWLGEDTGYQQFRNSLWWSVPLSGPPPTFTSYSDYQTLIKELVETKSIKDATHIYWDLRLSERFNTVEFRIMDACTNIHDTITIAGLIRAIVRTSYQQVLDQVPAPQVSNELLRTAHWRAARYGLQADLINVGTRHNLPSHIYIEQMLEFLRPALEDEGDWQLVSHGIRRILREGNGASRQKAVYQHTGRIQDVVKAIVTETRDL